jgi:hypothetical protein
MMKTIIILFLFSLSLCAQVTQEQIKEVLILQGEQNSDAVSHLLYEKQITMNSYQTPDLLEGIGFSAASGVSLGAFESNAFNYTHDQWLPKFMQQWYEWNLNTDMVLGKIFMWQKVWREVDYATDRAAYSRLKKYFAGKWFIAFPIHWIVKNTFATMIRDKMKHDRFFYSFDFDFVLPAGGF